MTITVKQKIDTGLLKKRIIELYRDGICHKLTDDLKCVNCGKTFEHKQVEIAKGKFMKEVMRIVYPHPSRWESAPSMLTHHDVRRIVDEMKKELQIILDRGPEFLVESLFDWFEEWLK